MSQQEIDKQDIRIGTPLSEQDQLSIDILDELQNSYFFRKERDKDTIRVYKTYASASEATPDDQIPVENFYKAVNYYYENRMGGVSLQMGKPDGKVDVYSPHIPTRPDDRRVVLRLNNYFVPEMLEFAFLLALSELQKTDK